MNTLDYIKSWSKPSANKVSSSDTYDVVITGFRESGYQRLIDYESNAIVGMKFKLKLDIINQPSDKRKKPEVLAEEVYATVRPRSCPKLMQALYDSTFIGEKIKEPINARLEVRALDPSKFKDNDDLKYVPRILIIDEVVSNEVERTGADIFGEFIIQSAKVGRDVIVNKPNIGRASKL